MATSCLWRQRSLRALGLTSWREGLASIGPHDAGGLALRGRRGLAELPKGSAVGWVCTLVVVAARVGPLRGLRPPVSPSRLEPWQVLRASNGHAPAARRMTLSLPRLIRPVPSVGHSCRAEVGHSWLAPGLKERKPAAGGEGSVGNTRAVRPSPRVLWFAKTPTPAELAC